MKKYVVLVMAAIAFLLTFETSEAQILQRFRSNIREAISPQTLPQRQIQTYNSAPPQARLQSGISNQPRYVQPQVRIQRPAPQRSTSGPQQLTPYSRLPPQQRVSIPQQRVSIPQQRVSIPQQRVSIPQQRVSIPQQRVVIPQQRILVPQQQLSNGPRLNAPVPVGNAAVGSAGGTTIRVVTHLDPRSGRTYQRRYLLPGNPPTGIYQGTQGLVTTGRRPIFTPPTATFGTVAGNSSVGPIPQSVPSAVQSLVPPIQFSPQVAQQPAIVSPGLLPALTGPALSASSATAQPIAASIESFDNTSQVETASAQVETASAEVETASAEFTSAGIPDLSGITVEPAPMTPAEEESQDFFFDDDSADEEVEATTDEIAEGPDYSVFEEVEEE